jgi:hypothetical protein
MKEIVTKKTKVKYIEIPTEEFETVIIYQTEDGETFTELRDAKIHEAELKFDKAEKQFFWFPMIADVWYKAKDEDELEFLKNHVSKTYGRRYGEDRLKVGEWFTVVHKDRDGTGNLADHFVSLSKLKKSYSELMEILEKK